MADNYLQNSNPDIGTPINFTPRAYPDVSGM
jgi:hypothetical protein